MKTFIAAVIFVLAGVVFLNMGVYAGPPSRYKHADRNKDGTVDKHEWKMEKKWEQKQKPKVNTPWENKADKNNDGKVDSVEYRAWKNNSSRVNTTLEKKYDSNGDGFLQPDEAKEYLSAKYDLIKSNGKAKVDSSLEAEYDTDNDGIIDQDEAEALKEDL